LFPGSLREGRGETPGNEVGQFLAEKNVADTVKDFVKVLKACNLLFQISQMICKTIALLYFKQLAYELKILSRDR